MYKTGKRKNLGMLTKLGSFEPSQLTGLQYWYKADAGVYSDSAAQFTIANSEFLSIPDASAGDFEFGDNDFTIAGWAYFDATSGQQTITGKYTVGGGVREFLLYLNGTSLYWSLSSDGSAVTNAIKTGVSSGAWYFIVASYDAASDTMSVNYNDGTAVTASHSGGTAATTSPFTVGSWNGAGYLGGRIDSLGVWDRILTASEQTFLYNSGVGQTSADLGIAGTDGSNLLTNCISWWDFNEASGIRYDAIGSNHLNDNNTVTQVAGIAAGDATTTITQGKAQQFTSANSECYSLNSGDASSLSPGDADFTIAGWFYLDATGVAYKTMMSKFETTGNQREYFCACQSSTPNFRYSEDGTTINILNWSTTVSAGQWYFWVSYHDSVNNEVGLIIDDGTPVTASFSAGIHQGTSDFYIGASSAGGGPTNFMNGRCDSWAFWDRTLTAAEITYLYNRGLGRSYDGIGVSDTDGSALKTSLVSWWDLDNNGGNTTDAHGSNNLSNVNTVTQTDGITVHVGNDAPVSRWEDQSGNGVHLYQSTVSARPTYQLDQLNSLPSVLGDGSSSYMISNPDTTFAGEDVPFTAFGTSKATATGGLQLSIGLTNNTLGDPSLIFSGIAGTNIIVAKQDDSATSVAIYPTTADTNAAYFTQKDSGVLGSYWENGTEVDSDYSTDVGTITLNTLSMFANYPAGSPTAYWGGEIFEFGIYNDEKSDGDVGQINSYMAGRYGL